MIYSNILKGSGSGMHPYVSFLSSPDETPLPILTGEGGEGLMAKKIREYKLTDYGQLLRDPRWQKKRLEIMSRDSFKCATCDDDKSTLNVHHIYYMKGNNPWDYPDKALITLCEKCHEHESINLPIARQNLMAALGNFYNSSIHIQDLADAFSNEDARLCIVIAICSFLQEHNMDNLARKMLAIYTEEQEKK